MISNLKKEDIFIIDDSQTILVYLEKYFLNKKYNVKTYNPLNHASLNKELDDKLYYLSLGFTIANKLRPRDCFKPEILVIDYNLHEKINGIELAICLKKDYCIPQIPTIFISGDEINQKNKLEARNKIEICEFIESKKKLPINIEKKIFEFNSFFKERLEFA